ncbi:MAG: ATP-binding protein [Sphingomonadaceae bacterium]|nr:ATP-binding protein [Sphingomonadaceae bacterium]
MTDQSDPLARIAATLERLVPQPGPKPDWQEFPAYVWTGNGARAVERLGAPRLDLLRAIDDQKSTVVSNVLRFAQGHAAHDMLLWGSRGMGKSALLQSGIAFAQIEHPGRIALVQVPQEALAGITGLFTELGQIDRQFLVFIDDLGFEDNDGNGPRQLRSWLEGGVEARPANVRLAVTSNRRAIVPRRHAEQDDPVNPRDALDDKLALADRFGLSIGFHNCSQEDYLDIIAHYAQAYDLSWNRSDALEWSRRRGARSGRIAWHYIVELAGRTGQEI